MSHSVTHLTLIQTELDDQAERSRPSSLAVGSGLAKSMGGVRAPLLMAQSQSHVQHHRTTTSETSLSLSCQCRVHLSAGRRQGVHARTFIGHQPAALSIFTREHGPCTLAKCLGCAMWSSFQLRRRSRKPTTSSERGGCMLTARIRYIV